MDAISDNNFTDVGALEVPVDDPSLLTIIIDLLPQGWFNIREQTLLQEVVKLLLVFVNAHLALNNANQVAVVASATTGLRFLYPRTSGPPTDPSSGPPTDPPTGPPKNPPSESPGLVNANMYRQFRLVDEAVLAELNAFIDETAQAAQAAPPDANGTASHRLTLAGALSRVLTYTNRMLNLDQSIRTTTASAISTTTNAAALGRSRAQGSRGTAIGASGGSSGGGASGGGAGGLALAAHGATNLTSMTARILVVTPSDGNDANYIAIMNAIFAAQKMRLPIDVAKLGLHDSAYLQQACDTTNGIYLHIERPQGLIQVLCTAYFVEPSIRALVILPTNASVNYRASCFITGKSVDMGYVCSVCLCIMSLVPAAEKCPTCGLQFDRAMLVLLRRAPVVAPRKKRALEA